MIKEVVRAVVEALLGEVQALRLVPVGGKGVYHPGVYPPEVYIVPAISKRIPYLISAYTIPNINEITA